MTMQTLEQQREIFMNMSREVQKDSPTYFRVIIKWLDDKFSEPFHDGATIRTIGTLEDNLVFLKFEEAENMVKNVESRKNASLYSVRIDEMKDGSSLHRNRPIQSWLYDGTGALVDHIVNENNGFFGVPKENRRFRIGDIVETLKYDYKMRLGVVVDMPKTPEEAWEDAVTLAKMTKSEIVNGLHPDENGYEVCYADYEFQNIVTENPLNLMHYVEPTTQQNDKLLKHLEAYTRIRNAMKIKRANC